MVATAVVRLAGETIGLLRLSARMQRVRAGLSLSVGPHRALV